MIQSLILKTTKKVAEQSKDVKINRQQAIKLAALLKKKTVPSWPKQYHLEGSIEEKTQYLFILDSINFSFFADKHKQKWSIKYKGKNISGYFALSLALKRAAKNSPLLKASFLSSITASLLENILGGQGKIPLLKERQTILNENGKILLKKFNGQAVSILNQSNHSAQKFIKILLDNFPSFRDIAKLKGNNVYFLKRAQILAADIYGAFSGKGLGAFYDIDRITCFADYKIPQILEHFQVLEYSPKLLEKIKQKEKIRPGSRQEIEIRANTIQAVELLKKYLKQQGRELRSFEVDWILWNMAKKEKTKIPHHMTRTIFY